jgi:23S rRNA (adenine2503-C2)-methyltransferase
MGLMRNLSASEIVAQWHAARFVLGAPIDNVVFMGMGEPMDNLDNVIESIRRMNDEAGRDKAGALSYHAGEAGALSYHAGRAGALSNQRDKAGALSNQRDKAGALSYPIPRRRVTVSTVGRCEGIRRLAALGWRRLNLAVSLNAPNDEIRSRIMPINRVEPMAELREAIRAYPVRAGGHVLIEYVLIKDVNDRPEHARELAEYLAGLSTCVNLIPYNPIEGGGQSTEQVRQSSKGVRQSSSFVRSSSVPFEPSTEAACDEFQTILMQLGQLCFRRWTKGQRAMAACGQLGNLALRRFSR